MLRAEISKLPPRKENGPAVTIVMPTFRRAHAIGTTIKTLLDGTWSDFELLVRDDGDGTDGTREAVAAATKGDSRVQYHRNLQNLGMPGNLNEGIKESRGEFIAVCHDHDLYKLDFLRRMVDTLRRNPTALFVHCGIESITEEGNPVQTLMGAWPEITQGAQWLKFMLRSLHCPVCALTIVRREAHEEFGLYDPSYGFISDVEMWMRLSLHGDVAFVNQPLIQVRQREDNHAETANAIRWLRTAAAIQRRYLSHAYRKSFQPLKRLRLELLFSNYYLRHQALRIAHFPFRRLQ